ncbi:MAG TPA: hypothetical protein VK752_05255 [Bryobacteraceae bacterium]|jgi:hypothetical protein|nr:hypothetical protein [Bryobacteraceae bacterium]
MRADRLDIDRLQRIRETDVWIMYEHRVRERLAVAQRRCLDQANGFEEIRVAQGEAAALKFVLELPDAIEREIRGRKTDAAG